MNHTHEYDITVKWTGNRGHGTFDSRLYGREHSILASGKPELLGSSDPAFRGDRSKHNPEELLLASLSACHMLWYLDLCAGEGVVVVEYTDRASAVMEEDSSRSGRFTEATLRPVVTVSEPGMVEKARVLHAQANKMCFIANSVNFPVKHLANILVL